MGDLCSVVYSDNANTWFWLLNRGESVTSRIGVVGILGTPRLLFEVIS